MPANYGQRLANTSAHRLIRHLLKAPEVNEKLIPYQLTDEVIERWTDAPDPKFQHRVLKAQWILFCLRDDKKPIAK